MSIPQLLTLSIAFVQRLQKTFSCLNEYKVAIDAEEFAIQIVCGDRRNMKNNINVRCVLEAFAYRTAGYKKYYLAVICAKLRKIKFNIKLICLSKMHLNKIKRCKFVA